MVNLAGSHPREPVSSLNKGIFFLRWSLAWASDHAGLVESSPVTQVGWGPAQSYGPGWAQQKKIIIIKKLKKMFQRNYLNICDFPPIFTAF